MPKTVNHRGFTLIELLVVIAIIAILAAILFPVFARAREKARQSTCTSNQRQIAATIAMYSQDHDETTPTADNFWNSLKLDPGVMVCPTTGKNVPNGYVMNNNYTGVATGTIDDPTSVNSWFTCDGQHAATPEVLGSNGATYQNIAYLPTDTTAIHSGQSIISYADGHVSIGQQPLDYSNTPFASNITSFYPNSPAVNLAYYQFPVGTAVTTSESGNNGASVTNLLQKYNCNGYWNRTDGQETAPWIQLALPRPQRINKISFRVWSGQVPKNYKIWVSYFASDMGVESKLLLNATNSNNSQMIFTNSFSPRLAQYIRIQQSNLFTSPHFNMNGLSIYSLDQKPINSSYPISEINSGNADITDVSASPSWSTWDSNNTPYNFKALFVETQASDNAWDYARPKCNRTINPSVLKVKLPTSYMISKGIIDAYTSAGGLVATSARIDVSNDDVTYTTVQAATPLTVNANTYNWTATNAKYIKIIIVPNNSGNDNIFYRMDFFTP